MRIPDEQTNSAALLSETDRLIEAGDYALAEARLKTHLGESSAPREELLQLKLAVRRQRIKPEIAMQKLVQLMQEHKGLEGAHAFYSEVSKAAYAERASSMAFSHPPPAGKPEE